MHGGRVSGACRPEKDADTSEGMPPSRPAPPRRPREYYATDLAVTATNFPVTVNDGVPGGHAASPPFDAAYAY